MTPFSLSPLAAQVGEADRLAIDALLRRLFPICRSITGNGLRSTLAILAETMPLTLLEIPSGTEIFDWRVPDEWNIRDAYIKDASGTRVVDFQQSNLHVVNYSMPVSARMSLSELRTHLHSLPAQPKAIPYLTSYYKRDWGFCLSNEALHQLPDGEYEVHIDSELKPGSLTLAECVLPGESEEEVFLSSYCCHPSLANNELSGPITLVSLYRHLAALKKRRYTYRFFLGGETIGSLAYLHLRGELLKSRTVAGFVVTCCGDTGRFTYKKVRRADNILDRAVMHALNRSGADSKAVEFFPTGSDERQYCSPGFNLPVGSLMRSMYGTYAEYHTSFDDLSLVSAANLVETVQAYLNCIYTLEHNRNYINRKPFGEPMLSKYGLYQTLGGQKAAAEWPRQLRYCLNFSDGHHDLIDIAERLGQPLWSIVPAVEALQAHNLLEAA